MGLGPLIGWGSFLIMLIAVILIFLRYVIHKDI